MPLGGAQTGASPSATLPSLERSRARPVAGARSQLTTGPAGGSPMRSARCSRRQPPAVGARRPRPGLIVAFMWPARLYAAYTPPPIPCATAGTPSSAARAEPARDLLRLQRNVLVGRRVGVAGDEAEARLLDARPHAVQEGQFPNGRVHDLVVNEVLDLVQGGLAALPVQLVRLRLEQAVEVRVAAGDVGPAGESADNKNPFSVMARFA